MWVLSQDGKTLINAKMCSYFYTFEYKGNRGEKYQIICVYASDSITMANYSTKEMLSNEWNHFLRGIKGEKITYYKFSQE